MQMKQVVGFTVLGVFLFYAQVSRADDAFHVPVTDAEKALDYLLASDRILFNDKGSQQKSPGFHEFMIDYPGRDKAHDTSYGLLFTKPLLAAWRQAERKAVEKNCRGHYKKGELCGIDYDMLICAQDQDDSYLYRTDSDDGRTARITYMWPENGEQVARYSLVKDDKGWRLDSVDCADGGASFNMK